MTDLFLYSGEANPTDITLSDPTVLRSAGTAYTLSAATGTFTATGVSASVVRGYPLVAMTGTVVLTGQAATLLEGYRLTSAAGTFTLSGSTAAVLLGARLSALSPAFIMTGVPAGLGTMYSLTAASGVFTLSGAAATLTETFILRAATGTILDAGSNAGLAYSGQPSVAYTLAAAAGVFALTGSDALIVAGTFVNPVGAAPYRRRLLRHRTLAASVGTFIDTSRAATLRRTYRLAAESGSVALVGHGAGVHVGYRVTARPLAFVSQGTTATPIYEAYVIPRREDAELWEVEEGDLLIAA